MVIVSECDRNVADRDLPGADQLIAADLPANGTIPDRDQKRLVGHGRQTQHAIHRLAQINPLAIRIATPLRPAAHFAPHLRRLAEQCLDRHVHRLIVELPVAHDQLTIVGDLADHGVRATFALRDRAEALQTARRQGEHVALLRLIAPDLKRRHAGFGVGNRPQRDAGAAMAMSHCLGHRIGEATGTDIVNQLDRIVLA